MLGQNPVRPTPHQTRKVSREKDVNPRLLRTRLANG